VEWKLGEINYVKSHMETKHKRLLNMNEEDKKASIVNFFPTKEQLNTRPMSKANQELGGACILSWMQCVIYMDTYRHLFIGLVLILD